MPASIATSSRRSPGTRRRPTGRPWSSGRVSSRRARRNSPNRFGTDPTVCPPRRRGEVPRLPPSVGPPPGHVGAHSLDAMTYDLTGRTAVVTGASSGIGAATARALAAAGGRVAVLARRVERIESLAKEIDGLAVPADVTDPESIATAAAAIRTELGRPDLVV